MQLKPARAQIHKVGDREFLLVERYDRVVTSEGSRQRLHQEDFC
jgi:serine/threonine-protein kinase HipA